MTTVVDWLNDHNGLVTAIATVLLALTTIYYAYVTRGLLKENVLLRRASDQPQMVAFVTPHNEIGSIVDMIVQNVGTGPAYDVSIELIGNPADIAAHGARLPLTRTESPFRVFPQGHLMRLFFGVGHELLRLPKMEDFSLCFSYQNGRGKIITSQSKISVHSLDGLTPETNSHLRDIAKSLDGIKRVVEKLQK